MKRVFLLVVILGMCLLVTIGGTITFLNSNSVLKYDAQYVSDDMQRNLVLSADLKSQKIYLISKGKVIKTYQMKFQEGTMPPPRGEWKVVSKDTYGIDGKWLGINIPWGRYGIHGEKEPFTIVRSGNHICITLRENDMIELYAAVSRGTPIRLYGINRHLFDEIRVLKPGDRGADIYEIQKNMKIRGYYKGFMSGIYNREFEEAVHEFQRKNGLVVSDYLNFHFYVKVGMFNKLLIK